MFVLFGFGHRTNKEYKMREVTQCYHCNNASNWIMRRQMSWFTLFFIPLVPYRTDYSIFCPICKNGYKITQEEFEKKSNGN